MFRIVDESDDCNQTINYGKNTVNPALMMGLYYHQRGASARTFHKTDALSFFHKSDSGSLICMQIPYCIGEDGGVKLESPPGIS
jgi:hypothetical protein